jgi:hypothetical protein
MAQIFRSDFKITGQSQGIPGPAGSTGVVTAGASFTLPANAVETIFTLSSTITVLEDGQTLYGVLPSAIPAKLRRDGSQYFIKSLFKLTDPVLFPINTKFYIASAQAVLAIAADVTIAVSGPTPVQVDPNPLVAGGSIAATVAEVSGVLKRDVGGTTFTPKNTLSAPLPLSAFIHPVIVSADPRPAIQLGSNPNGLKIDQYGNLDLGDSEGIESPVPFYGPRQYPLAEKESGFIELILSASKGILWGVGTDGAIWIEGVPTRPIGGNNLGAVEAWTDLSGRLSLGIGEDGSILTGWGKIKQIPQNNFGLLDAITDESGKPLFGVKTDLSLYAPGVLSAPLEAYGSIYFLAPDENGNRQIWRMFEGTSIQLTFRGDNSAIALGENNTLLFVTNRNSSPEYYRMEQDGKKQFYCFLRPDGIDTTLNHILVTGQSLSRGFTSSPILTTMQPYNNLKFNTGTMNADYFANGAAVNVSPTSFVPLTENTVETGYATLANKVTQFANSVIKTNKYGVTDYRVLVSGHGYSAAAYSNIKKGSQCYTDGLDQITKGRSIAIAQGLTNKVRAVFVVHGESDHLNLNSGYEANLMEWYNDYNADIAAIYGVSANVPMFHSQMSSWGYYNVGVTSLIPAAQLAAHRNNPGRIICVCPKYFLPYYTASDNVHLTNEGEQVLWSYYAKAYAHVVLQGKVWTGVQPTAITRSGLVITATFSVPYGPLVLDTTNVTNPGNFGFEVVNSSNVVLTISSVVLSGSQVIVTVASGTPARLRYAYRSNTGGGLAAGAGPTIGPRGNLRDSAPVVHSNGFPLHNWCMHFDDPIV